MEKVNRAVTLGGTGEIPKDLTHACRALRSRDEKLASIPPERNEKDVPNLRSQPATPGTLPLNEASLGPDQGIVEDNSRRDLWAYFDSKIAELVNQFKISPAYFVKKESEHINLSRSKEVRKKKLGLPEAQPNTSQTRS